MLKRILLLGTALSLALPASAMTPPSVSANVVPRSSVSGLHAPSGDGWGFGLTVWQSTRDSLRAGRKTVDNPSREKTSSLRSTLFLDYSLTQRIILMLAVPHVRNQVSFAGTTQNSEGLGDAALYGKYALYRDRMINPTRELQLVAGVDFPTGETEAADSQGVRLPITQQPGSDSTDATFGAALIWGFPLLSAYGDLTYRLNGGAAYTFGNVLALNAGVNVPIASSRWSFTGELNAEVIARDTSSLTGPGVLPNKEVRDSGGETVYATPGVQWRPAPGWAVNAGVQLPIYQYLRGTQLAAEANYILAVFTRFGRANAE